MIESRWADGHLDRLSGLLAEIISRNVDVIVTWGTPAAVAAKNSSSTVPIVAVAMGEPLRTGLAATLARPGGNLTGLSTGLAEGVAGKWLELLQEAVPRLTTVAVIGDPENPIARELMKELKAIAPTRNLKLRFIEIRDPSALPRAFERARREAQAAMVLPHPLIFAHRAEVTALAAKQRLPTIYTIRDYAEVGGLLVYTPDYVLMYRRAAEYVDKILKGVKPGDLPIEQPTKFELIVNLRTARALGLKIPDSILLRADEVIR
jgi:putative ABC transport system substrate-binding protein